MCRGERRNVEDDNGMDQTAYDIVHIPLTVFAREQAASPHSDSPAGQQQLLDKCNKPFDDENEFVIPSMLSEAQDLPELPPHLLPASRGYLSRTINRIKGIPACIWVVNEHTEAITVVVSQYRPSRLWTEAGLNISTTGVGFDLSTTSFTPPVTRKTLPAAIKSQKPLTAAFPLWTRRDGFGVITVFVGVGQTLYIENDRIPMGATAYFRNEPNLHIVGFEAL
ncbi:hypothetical protein N7533_008717 [Penicillium manginii]|uniref:uncharacterized protein n=1 Tax=Penicillium manginii TaxID=203109 RepID=UPI0025466910|nr:uncharacterized protein N7533_008717 [Penicillium manginii]KAJ5743847.1 hypothetical protein N7533_008717 [Penicillium manginii]